MVLASAMTSDIGMNLLITLCVISYSRYAIGSFVPMLHCHLVIPCLHVSWWFGVFPSLTGQRDLFLLRTTAGGRHISEFQQQLSVAASTCTDPGGLFGAPAVSHLEPWWPAAVQSADLWPGAPLPDFADQQWASPSHTPDISAEDVRSVSWWGDPFCSSVAWL